MCNAWIYIYKQNGGGLEKGFWNANFNWFSGRNYSNDEYCYHIIGGANLNLKQADEEPELLSQNPWYGMEPTVLHVCSCTNKTQSETADSKLEVSNEVVGLSTLIA